MVIEIVIQNEYDRNNDDETPLPTPWLGESSTERREQAPMTAPKVRLAILISGSGGVMQAILDACRRGELDAEVVGVFSHEPYAYGLLRAEREGVPAFAHDLSDYRFRGLTERDFERELADKIEALGADMVVLAEWALPLGETFLERFPNRVINLHEGLPGQFPVFDPYMRNPVSRVYDAFTAGLIRETGVTAHILRDPMQTGPVLAAERVPIYEFDTLADVEERFYRVKCEMLVNVLRQMIEERQQDHQSEQA